MSSEVQKIRQQFFKIPIPFSAGYALVENYFERESSPSASYGKRVDLHAHPKRPLRELRAAKLWAGAARSTRNKKKKALQVHLIPTLGATLTATSHR